MFFKQYFTALVTFLVIDAIWLLVVAKNFYANYLGHLMSQTPNLFAAGLFYLIYVLGLVVLVIAPAIQKKSLAAAVSMGALLGLCAYATYDLTNLATLREWPVLVTVVDLVWGTFVTGAVAGMSFLLLTKHRS